MSLLSVRDLEVRLAGPRRHLLAKPATIHALRGVSFDMFPGETLAVVGESGSGKSTLARALLRLVRPYKGQATLGSDDLLVPSPQTAQDIRRRIQMVFQDPYSSLNRRMKIGTILREPLRHHRFGDADAQTARLNDLVAEVGLHPDILSRLPSALSGGQRQRVAIARALALHPQLVVCDEAISALDVSVQAQILNLLTRLKHDLGLAYLFITHDLGVVRRFADRIAVMHAGRIVELAPASEIFTRPLHPYTRGLLSAVPRLNAGRDETRTRLLGEPVSALSRPKGCLFASRCAAFQRGVCDESDPDLIMQRPNHLAACHQLADSGVAPRNFALTEIPA